MSEALFVMRVFAAVVAITAPITGFAAAQTTQSVKQHLETCSQYAAARLLDCPCVEKEAARLIGVDKASPSEVVFDRAAAACPSAFVKANAVTGDLRFRHHSFEERQAIRRMALEFVAALDASSADDAVDRIMGTPWTAALLNRMPTARPQMEQRVREVLARRAARGKLTDRRVDMIGAMQVQLTARAEQALPGIEGEGAYAAVEVIKIEWSANGDPEVAEYDFPY
jgi:hypothetical protein